MKRRVARCQTWITRAVLPIILPMSAFLMKIIEVWHIGRRRNSNAPPSSRAFILLSSEDAAECEGVKMQLPVMAGDDPPPETTTTNQQPALLMGFNAFHTGINAMGHSFPTAEVVALYRVYLRRHPEPQTSVESEEEL